MRTTLTIDDDVLAEAKVRAQHTGRTTGEVISELAREALVGKVDDAAGLTRRNGFVVFPHRGGVVTNELIDELREEEGV